MIPFSRKYGKALKQRVAVIAENHPAAFGTIARMRKRPPAGGLYAVFVVIFTLASCCGLPRIKPAEPPALTGIEKQCLRPFPTTPLRLIHSVEAVWTGGTSMHFLGVLLIDPQARSVRSVMMTLEGFVLFDAEWTSTLKVHRGVPPFDSPAYAEHMMKDIRLLIFPPRGRPKETGFSTDGFMICRFRDKQGETIDINITRESTWIIRLYNKQDMPIRTVRTSLPDRRDIPARIDLEAPGEGYALHMTLISAESVVSGSIQNK